MARDQSTPRKGVSLAKGPVGIIGIVGIVYGLSALILKSHGFSLHIPHGAVHGEKWIGLEVNGWSDLLFIAAGLALLLAAPLHWGAKGMSLLVGWVMIAAALIALVRKDGVFGIFAANHLTELVWAAAGVLLLILALLPRVGRRQGESKQDAGARRTRVEDTPVAQPAASQGSRHVVRRSRAHEPGANDQHARWMQNADPQDRPRSAGAQRTDDTPSR